MSAGGPRHPGPAPGDRPLLVHVSAQRFAETAHPGIHRQIRSLAPWARNLVLEIGDGGYVVGAPGPGPGPEGEGAEVWRPRRERLRHREFVAYLTRRIRRRLGPARAVVAHMGNSGWRALGLAAGLDAPLVTILHGADGRSEWSKPALAWRFALLKEAPGAWILGVSGNVAEDAVAWGADPERVGVQHLGIDLTRLPAAPPEPPRDAGGLRVAIAGRFVAFKGHEHGLRAFARHRRRHPASRLDCYGDGPLRADVEALAARLGLGGAVRFHGTLPVGELTRALAACDVLLQPSVRDDEGREEGLPNTILEAMALGRAVVASRHAGIPEAVVDGETGLLAAERDEAALAAALDALAAHPARRVALGQAGRARVEARFDAAALGAALAERLAGIRRAYEAIPPGERAAAWARATGPLLKAGPRADRWRYRALSLVERMRAG